LGHFLTISGDKRNGISLIQQLDDTTNYIWRYADFVTNNLDKICHFCSIKKINAESKSIKNWEIIAIAFALAPGSKLDKNYIIILLSIIGL
jgi:hypothetical protein